MPAATPGARPGGRCATCRFEAAAYTRDDEAGTLRAIEPWWELLTAGLDEAVRTELGPPPDPDDLHGALHRLHEAGRQLHERGAGTPAQQGRVAHLHVGAGGVPKSAVETVTVGYRGVVGDRQRTRRHHGRVWQALCLYSVEAVDTLRGEGHPIFPGAAGENITITGLDWASLRPGARLHLGSTVAVLSMPALPCKKNAAWFTDGDFMRMHHERNPALTRWYASVMTDGTVALGDPVIIDPVIIDPVT